jgi:hypothetical protein
MLPAHQSLPGSPRPRRSPCSPCIIRGVPAPVATASRSPSLEGWAPGPTTAKVQALEVRGKELS